ncbi:Dyp-type peroxidase [Bradyrhizobium sp. JR3.5]
MGAGSVTNSSNTAPSWKLASPHDVQTQGIVVSGFGSLPAAQALFLEFGTKPAAGGAAQGPAGSWLQALMGIAPITDADEADKRAACIAFTWTGLQKLGLPEAGLASFSAPFSEGMYQEDRLRRLGDKINDTWQATVIDGGPLWSANIPARKNLVAQPKGSPLGNVGGSPESEERQVKTATTVHVLLLLYDTDETAVTAWASAVEQALAPWSVRVVHRLLLDLRLDQDNVGREHFGFADGISQPLPYEKVGSGDATVLVDSRPAPQDYWNGVPLGDILIGHNDLHNEKSPGPVIPDSEDGKGRAAGLTAAGAPEGLLNFGLNGSYMVVRELRQNVAAFWKSLKDEAERISRQDPSAKPVSDLWLAERVIGRSIDGHLLCPDGKVLPADQFNFPRNDFLFKKTDPQGFGCPLGSHVRRANPRDSLAKDMASVQTLLDAANNHRILRRGRKYGSTIQQRDQDDHAERGLLFMCLNSDIARQFEFIQQRWLLNRNFSTLFDETDPLIGPKGPFTVNEQPLRKIVDVETYIQCAGGDYFFLPSIPALNYLATI